MANPERTPKHGSSLNPRWAVIGIIVFAFAVVLVPVLLYSLPSESSKWQIAVAKKKYAAGETDEAVELMRQSIQEMPDDDEAKITLAKWLAETGKHREAIEIARQLYDENPKNEAVANEYIQILQLCGRHRTASELFEEINQDKKLDSAAARISHLNQIAYMRALGGRELDDAAVKIDMAIQQWEKLMSRSAKLEMFIDDAVVLAVLEISYSRSPQPVAYAVIPSVGPAGIPQVRPLNRIEANLLFLEAHLKTKFASLALAKRRLKYLAGTLISEELPLKGDSRQQLVQARKNFHRHQESLAALLAARAFLYQRLGNDEQATRNRSYVLGLGFDAQEMIDRMPGTDSCLGILASGPAFLDTRGFVQFKLGNHQQAVRDLDIAVRGTMALLETDEINNSFSLTAIELKQNIAEVKRTRNVLFDHRRRALERTNRIRAAADREQLNEWGAEPSSKLY